MTTATNQAELTALNAEKLKQLATASGQPCVSILMRTHRRGREIQQGSIRLKNLLKEAVAKLTDAGHDDSILGPLQSKLEDSQFWQQQGDGLAIYLTTDSCQMFRLNRSVDEIVSVGQAFCLQPLIRESNAAGEYFVLSLSWDEAKLFRGNGGSLEPIETTSLPAKFEDLVLPRDPEESLQNTSHRSVGNTGGTSVGMFHGQGEGEDKIEADRNQYLTLVGDELAGAIYNTGLPLVVVATKEVVGHFEATTKVSVDAKVEGSPSELSDDELREKTRDAITPQLKADHEQFDQRFGTAVANSQGSHDLDEVLTAAKRGRVESLMVCPAANRSDVGHCDEVNQAVVDTLRNGGDVMQCQADFMPTSGSRVAAIFRY